MSADVVLHTGPVPPGDLLPFCRAEGKLQFVTPGDGDADERGAMLCSRRDFARNLMQVAYGQLGVLSGVRPMSLPPHRLPRQPRDAVSSMSTAATSRTAP